MLIGQKDYPRIREAFLLGTKISIIMATFLGACLILYGRAFIVAWVGGAYVDSYTILVILVVAIYCDVAQHPSTSYLYGVAKHKLLAIITMIEGILNVVLSLLLVRELGLVGVALGVAIPMIVMRLFVQPFYVLRSLRLNIWEYYFRLFIPAILVTTLVVVVPWIFVFRRFLEPSIWRVGILVGLQGCIASPILYFFAFSRVHGGRYFKLHPFIPSSN
jgi:O-antigen/teichoic acid export membrane protein